MHGNSWSSNYVCSYAGKPCFQPLLVQQLENRNYGRGTLSDRGNEKVQSNMHVPEITIAYGMTETSPVSFQSATDDPLERRVSTVGKVQPHIQVKIIDENGKVVARGTKGELCTRGYSVMKGYWDDYDKTNQVLTESGWMKTGDLAIIDDSGYGNIVGRVKDMIIRRRKYLSKRN